MNDIYLRTARLLTQVAPSVFVDETFALKGGTAINLFYRDMPRLSVDLDLVFCDYTLSRTEAVAKIDSRDGRATARAGIHNQHAAHDRQRIKADCKGR